MEEKLQNVLDFYMLANGLKHRKAGKIQSEASHVYGAMTLWNAIKREYELVENEKELLQNILLENMKKVDPKALDEYLERQNMSLKLSKNEKRIIDYCNGLDRKLSQFLTKNKFLENNYDMLYHYAKKENIFGTEYLTNPSKNYEIFRFYVLNCILKNKDRSGWDEKHWNISSDVREKVAEHVVTTMALATGIQTEFQLPIDLNWVNSTLSIHEVGEIAIGDITPFDGTSKEEKEKIEHQAMREIIGNLQGHNEMLTQLFAFDERRTLDAMYAYYCDKLEADIQSKVYYDREYHHSLDDQQNNVVFQNKKVQDMIQNNVVSNAFDVWYEWDKGIYKESKIFTKMLQHVKNTNLK